MQPTMWIHRSIDSSPTLQWFANVVYKDFHFQLTPSVSENLHVPLCSAQLCSVPERIFNGTTISICPSVRLYVLMLMIMAFGQKGGIVLLRKCSAVEQAASGGIAVIVYHRSTLEEQKKSQYFKAVCKQFHTLFCIFVQCNFRCCCCCCYCYCCSFLTFQSLNCLFV